jgi:hypothetical protein
MIRCVCPVVGCTVSFIERSFPMENKKVSFEFVEGVLIVKVDLNGDGQPVIELKVSLAEIPDEIIDILKAKKEAPKA